MNRNVESPFAYNPQLDIKRSRFDRNSSVKFTFNVGELIPFYVDEVLPGDTFDIMTSKVVRLQTLLTPMMDNIYLDFYWFFVPNRLTWNHWKEFNGENSQGYWYPSVEYEVPQMSLVGGSSEQALSNSGYLGSVADYMGIPFPNSNNGTLYFNALPFRAYGLIYNEWFRDENLIEPDNVLLGDSLQSVLNSPTTRDYRNKPYLVSKYHDYFTSLLPSPQKGPDISVPFQMTYAPVVTGLDHGIYSVGTEQQLVTQLRFMRTDGDTINFDPSGRHFVTTDDDGYANIYSGSTAGPLEYNNVVPSNLWADINAGSIVPPSINQLRLAFQIQKLYEKDARGGTRYTEILKSHFGVTSPDYRLQRPEYLGGNRVPININQVIQNSQTEDTPLGHTGAMSVTSDIHSDFTRSFTEHGFVIGLVCARYDHTYQQGLERFWSRKSRFDYYFPVLANIGEMAVLNKEIYADGSGTDDEVMGYQEAWADYRYKPNRVAGEMRSIAPQSLDVWHLADYYDSHPYLSKAWIQEDGEIVDRVLAVDSSVSDQIFADIYVKNKTTRPMPLYSIPGLIDHH